jgi:hypothetical protein
MPKGFGYVPYASSQSYDYAPGSRISEIILRAGEAAARMQQQQAETLGSGITALGKIPGDVEAQRVKTEEREALAAKRKAETAEIERKRKVEASVSGALGSMGTHFSPEDVDRILSQAPPEARQGILSAIGDLSKIRSETEASEQKLNESRDYELAKTAHYYKATIGTPLEADAMQLLGGFLAKKHPEKMAELQGLAQSDPKAFAATIDAMEAKSPKLMQELADIEAKRAEPEFKERQLQLTRRGQDLSAGQAAATLAETRRGHDLAAGAGEGAPTLTPQAVDVAAKRYLADGTLPPMGMGKAGAVVRQGIINRAAEMDPEANIALNKATYGADVGSLKQLQKQRDAIGAFEQTAQKNIDVFLETAGKVVDTGSPLANQLLRHASGSMLGSPDVAAYEAARRVAVNEIAKITSNPTLAGQLSDTARKEVEEFNPSGATVAQTVEVMRLLKRDMTNRVDALDEQLVGIQRRLGAKPEESAKPTGPAKKVGIFTITPVGGS